MSDKHKSRDQHPSVIPHKQYAAIATGMKDTCTSWLIGEIDNAETLERIFWAQSHDWRIPEQVDPARNEPISEEQTENISRLVKQFENTASMMKAVRATIEYCPSNIVERAYHFGQFAADNDYDPYL